MLASLQCFIRRHTSYMIFFFPFSRQTIKLYKHHYHLCFKDHSLFLRIPGIYKKKIICKSFLLYCIIADWLSSNKSTCQCRRCGVKLWVRKIPWRKKWQCIPLFLPGKSHGQSNLAGYSPWAHRVRHSPVTNHTHTQKVKTCN